MSATPTHARQLTYLSQINAHPRDAHITFREEDHVYTICRPNTPAVKPLSVTTLIHHYFPKFEPEKIVDKMMANREFPHAERYAKYRGMSREQILAMWASNEAAELGTAMHAQIEEYLNCYAQSLREPQAVNLYQAVDAPKVKEYLVALNAAHEQLSGPLAILNRDILTLKAQLETLRRQRNAGDHQSQLAFQSQLSELEVKRDHIQAQIAAIVLPEYANEATIVQQYTPEFQLFLRFWVDFQRSNPNVELYRTEWIIYDNIAGSIDCVLRTPEGKLIILDWKRSKEIKTENKWERGTVPFQNFPHCNFYHYTLQLNMYRHMLETRYGQEVIYMMLVILHPQQTSPLYFPIDRVELNNVWDTLPMIGHTRSQGNENLAGGDRNAHSETFTAPKSSNR